MHSFAHLADVHLGAHREPIMRELEMKAFKLALDKCMERHVDFILICGDLFHVCIPDLAVVDEAIKKMGEVGDNGIPIYVIYGSHDYSPNSTSIIDIIASSRIIKKIVDWRFEGDKIHLNFVQDPKTGAKLTGISARKVGLESRYYEMIDRDALEREKGFKIFTFHSALDEFKPDDLSSMESFAASLLPRGFDYYAGGHVHNRSENKLSDFDKVVYPGPVFPRDARDLERMVKGQKLGFYIASFDEKIRSLDFVEVSVFDGVYIEHDLSGQTAIQGQKDLLNKIKSTDANGKLVLLKVIGQLSEGKTSDIDFRIIRQVLLDGGAFHVEINRQGIRSKEHQAIKVSGESISEIETSLFKENIGSVNLSESRLKGDSGLELSKELLRALRLEPKLNESKRDYESRMKTQGIDILGVKQVIG